MAVTINDVLHFWFREAGPRRWFVKDRAFDEAVRAALGPAYERAAAGGLAGWRNGPQGCVALCVLLDQAPRNIFRGTPGAYATDSFARRIAYAAIRRRFDRAPVIAGDMRLFLYTPFEHSEELADQELCVRLFRERLNTRGYVGFAHRHLEIVRRFGRFPHRNAVLGRRSTAGELAFLETKGSSF